MAGIWVVLLSRKRKKTNLAVEARHRIAVKVGISATIFFVVTIVAIGFILFSRGVGADGPLTPEQRGHDLAIGAFLMSGWLGLASYGITRLVLRIRSGPPRPEPKPPAPPAPDFSGLGGAHDLARNLENIHDEPIQE